MKLWRSITLGLAIVTAPALKAEAGSDDAWLITKARMVLLTTEGVSVKDLDVEVSDGIVTLHGRVRTGIEKEKAADAVSGIKGVKRVTNLMRVLPRAFAESPRIGDDALRRSVALALEADRSLGQITVASVNNGVVLLRGTARSREEGDRAVELAWSVAGVSRVVSRIETAGPRD